MNNNQMKYSFFISFLAIVMSLAGNALQAQEVTISYDASGNRTKLSFLNRPKIEVTPDSLLLNATDTSVYVVVKNIGDADLAWLASSGADWLTLITKEGVEDDTLFFSASRNPLREIRKSELSIIDKDSLLLPFMVYVEQAAGPNTAPEVVNPVPDQFLPVGFGQKVVQLDTVFADFNEDEITLESSTDQADVVNIVIDEQTATITELKEGTVQWVITASDGFGGEARDTVLIQVNSDPILTLSTDTIRVEADFTEKSFDVLNKGITDLIWQAESLSNWIILSGETSGTNDGTLSFLIAKNETLEPRIGQIQVMGEAAKNSPQTVTIVQAGIINTPPVQSQEFEDLIVEEGFTPIEIDLLEYFREDDEGDSLNFLVASDDEDVVMVAYNEPTLILNPSDDSGLATISIKAYDRLDTVPVSFKVSVLEVDQAILRVSADTINVDAPADNTSFRITNLGNRDMPWEVSTEADWISFVPSASGENDQDVFLVYEANLSLESRSAWIDILADEARRSPDSLLLVQAGIVNNPPEAIQALPDRELTEGFEPITIDLLEYFKEEDEGDSINFMAEVDKENIISLSYDEPKLSLNPGFEAGVATVTVKAFDRRDTISVDFMVTVNAVVEPTLFLDVDSIKVSSAAMSASFNIINQGTEDMSWTVSTTADWLTLGPEPTGTNDEMISVEIAENPTLDQRIAVINIEAGTATNSPGKVVVVQEGQVNTPPQVIQVLEDLVFEAGFTPVTIDLLEYFNEVDEGDALTFSPTLDDPEIISVSYMAPELVISHGTKTGTATISIEVMDRKDKIERSFTVTVNEVAEPILFVSTDTVFVDEMGGEAKFNITNIGSADMSWTLFKEATANWFEMSPESETNDSEVTLTIQRNVGFDKRYATIDITATGARNSPGKVVVAQAANSNSAPELFNPISDIVLDSEPPKIIRLSDHFRDADGDELIYEYTPENQNTANITIESDVMVITRGDADGTTITVTVTARDQFGQVSASFDVEYPAVTSTDDPEAAKYVKVYPNPANQFITIDLTNSSLITPTIGLVNDDGRVITEVKEVRFKTIQLDISQMRPGIYTLVMYDDNRRVTKRVRIEK